jgi:hypothetical protein
VAAVAAANARHLFFHMPIEGLKAVHVASMTSAISFRGSNSGAQIGVSHGPVTYHFHAPITGMNETENTPRKSIEAPSTTLDALILSKMISLQSTMLFRL